jgi:hypothetical protein
MFHDLCGCLYRCFVRLLPMSFRKEASSENKFDQDINDGRWSFSSAHVDPLRRALHLPAFANHCCLQTKKLFLFVFKLARSMLELMNKTTHQGTLPCMIHRAYHVFITTTCRHTAYNVTNTCIHVFLFFSSETRHIKIFSRTTELYEKNALLRELTCRSPRGHGDRGARSAAPLVHS